MFSDILITLGLVFLNGFFVAAEFAIVKVRASQLKVKADEGSKPAQLSSHIVSHLDGYLAATQLGITLASLGLGWVGEPVVSKIILNIFDLTGLTISPELAHNIALPVSFAIITVLHIVFGELAPNNTNYEIIRNAFDFGDRTVKQIMVPRNQVTAIDIKRFDDNVLNKIIEDGYSRIPCYENNIDNVIGLIYIKDMLAKRNTEVTLDIRTLIRPVILTLQSRKIGSLMKEFQQKHIQMAVVVDEFGGMEGIVTMEDIVEELVGEIQDEYDNEIPFVVKKDDKTYDVIATANLNDINEFLPYAIEGHEDVTSLAGIIIMKLGRIPAVNEKIRLDEYEITILSRVKNSVSLVQLVTD
ncbi:MAG: HlyC/CorC family transporter [Saprospiraceae bacterium]|nr:HlyC/CorC family transporter [Saprospiraceae bacterium]